MLEEKAFLLQTSGCASIARGPVGSPGDRAVNRADKLSTLMKLVIYGKTENQAMNKYSDAFRIQSYQNVIEND